MAILNNNPLVGASGNQGGYNINNSLRFRSSASAWLNRTFASAGSRTTFTISVWIKRGTLSTEQAIITQGSGNRDIVRINPDNTLFFYWFDAANYYAVSTTQVFRDPSAWYHIVVAVDTTQATSSNRVKLYVNGSQITALTSTSYPSQNFNFTYWGTTNPIAIGKDIVANNAHLDGYMAEFNFIDGSAKTPSDFGETDTTTGVWKPKAYTGTYGTNGFYLKFSDIATTSGSNAGLGKDFSGNSNYWTTNNISVTSGTTYDAMTDSPTNTSATVANYAVLNPLSKGTNVSITNANLAASYGSAAWTSAFGTIGVSTGKWYWEMTLTSAGTDAGVGISTNPAGSANSYIGGDANSWGYYASNGNKWNNNSQTSYGATYANGDVIGIALDLDAGTLVFYKNNVSQGTAFSSLASNTYFPALSVNNSSFAANFGQRPFSYTPPTGYVALNTFNIPDSTIKKGNTVMDAYIYTGDGNSTRTITLPIVADFVWSKNRTTANDHVLIDTVRGGTSPVKALFSNTTGAELTTTGDWGGYGYPDSLSGTSYAVVKGTQATSYTNKLNDSYVNWIWQAGQGSTSSNTSGSITSTVSVNTTAGFSIVTYTGNGTAGATVGHGLGVAPKMIIVKWRSSAGGSWATWHSSFVTASNTDYLLLDSTIAKGGAGSLLLWNNTAPTSSVFSIGTNIGVNTNTGTYVAYCWAEIAGFSRFGSYTGNGSADGPFVYTGFRPKFIMIKRTDSISNWVMCDTSRSTYNLPIGDLYANLSDAEDTATILPDILSNGFKVRTSNTTWNGNGGTFIYMAFAENPFKNSLAR